MHGGGELMGTKMNEMSVIRSEWDQEELCRASSKLESCEYGPAYF